MLVAEVVLGDRDRTGGLAGREGQRAGSRQVVCPRGGRAVSRGVADRHRLGAGLGETDREDRVARAAVPLGDRSGDGRTRFVFLGKLQKPKGLSLLLRAWADAALDAELVIAGDGPERATVEAATSDTVRYVGWVDAEAKAALIASATALVFPSLWPETFGLVIAESLLMGRPVVATPAAAGDLVIDGVNGVVAAEATPAAFAAALRRAATDPVLLRRITDGAAESAAALDFDRHVDHLDDVYRDARAIFAAEA